MATPFTSTVETVRVAAPGTVESLKKTTDVESLVVALFEQFRTGLVRYTLSLGLSVQNGEEITQEVFLALFQHLQLGKCRRNLLGWIFRVAHNPALKRRYAKQRLHGETERDRMAAERQLDNYPNPEEQVLSAQRQTRLLAALDTLPEQDRACLRLRAEGFTTRTQYWDHLFFQTAM